jgi:hypothetical protein
MVKIKDQDELFGEKEIKELEESLKESRRAKKVRTDGPLDSFSEDLKKVLKKMLNNYRIGRRSISGDGGRFPAAMSTLVRISCSLFHYAVKSTTTTYKSTKGELCH